MASPQIENLPPLSVWAALSENKNTALVDVRTEQEWNGIGRPDLGSLDKTAVFVEWRQAPDMSINPLFAAKLDDAFSGDYPEKLFFICRSGARSLEAAAHVQEILSSKGIDCECVNVAEGFEGDPGPTGARGTVNGWQYHQLSWQSG